VVFAGVLVAGVVVAGVVVDAALSSFELFPQEIKTIEQAAITNREFIFINVISFFNDTQDSLIYLQIAGLADKIVWEVNTGTQHNMQVVVFLYLQQQFRL
jgi:hypothetical protein